MGMFSSGTVVKTDKGTTGTVVSEIQHPVTRNTTAVVIQPTGTTAPDDRVITNPTSTRPVGG